MTLDLTPNVVHDRGGTQKLPLTNELSGFYSRNFP